MKYDLIIIGAGPAGMSAAIEACRQGLRCVVLDEQPRGGGQIYRNVGRQRLSNVDVLGPDYQAGQPMLVAFERSGCQHIQGATVWQITDSGDVFFSVQGQSERISGYKVLLATGAQERPMPFPGWTLPGVMTAGAAQILLKSPGVAAQGAVFAGCGPLLYLIVSQYLAAGVKVAAVLDTTEVANYRKAAGQWRAMLKGHRYLLKGLGMLWRIRKAGVPVYRNVTALSAQPGSDGCLAAVRFQTPAGEQTIHTDHCFIHQGVIPQVNLAMASGCAHQWDATQLYWQPQLDDWGQSSQPHLMIAGDGAGIAGAVAAAQRGRLAALQLACEQGQLSEHARDQQARMPRQILQRELAFRPFLDTLYRPADCFRVPQDDDTLVCRCEEVKVADIRAAVAQNCMGLNQLKSFTRCGMGACQGRQCGNTVSELMAHTAGQAVADIGYYRVRAPVKPLNLGELAQLADDD